MKPISWIFAQGIGIKNEEKTSCGIEWIIYELLDWETFSSYVIFTFICSSV